MIDEPKRILVVDDEPHIGKIIKLNLESAGYIIQIATNGREALNQVEKFSPDLILLDIMMPGMNGYDVLSHLRTRFKTSHIPIIFLTAKREINEKVTGLMLGADDYITKPFVTKELLARVNNILIKSSSLRTLSPLTGLPGNVSIQRETSKRLKEDKQHAWIYVDIDNFKHYNDHYGFIQGDEVIKFVANLLVEALEEKGSGTDFLGHVGGDDFLIITSEEKIAPVTDYIIDEIKKDSYRFFPPEDLKIGYYEHQTRNNVRARVPTELCLTMAVITNEKKEFDHPAQLSTVAAQVKEWGKSIEGSIVVYNRRRYPGC
ncbi:MAG: response regulator [Candidatus Glassbacteria bacterium]